MSDFDGNGNARSTRFTDVLHSCHWGYRWLNGSEMGATLMFATL